MLTLNGQPIDVTNFPDRTSQVWKLPPALLDAADFRVVWTFEFENELLHLAQLKALLDTRRKRSVLEIRYLPYARQDKEVANDATFALRPFATLLNALAFDEVILRDPHSGIALESIHRSRAVYPLEQVAKVMAATQANLVCYPDKGARTRYGAIYPYPSVHGEKVRNQQTGKITSYRLEGEAAGKRVLIVDDICDGGATFIALAKELKSRGVGGVYLFVTHGLFSQGLDRLREAGIERIFTAEGEAYQLPDYIAYKEIGS